MSSDPWPGFNSVGHRDSWATKRPPANHTKNSLAFGKTPTPIFPSTAKPKPSTPAWKKRSRRTDSSKCCCMRVITWFHLFRGKRSGLGACALLVNPTLVEVKMNALAGGCSECSHKSVSLEPKSTSDLFHWRTPYNTICWRWTFLGRIGDLETILVDLQSSNFRLQCRS